MNSRKRFEWRFKNRRISLGERTLIAGMIQAAPEYQPDGRDPLGADRAFVVAMEMEEAGADLILVGADALLPGVKRITEAEELRRIVPILKRLRDQVSSPVGLITDKASVAARGFELGVEVIFDPSGLTSDPELAKLIANHDAGFMLGHMRGAPETWPKIAPVKDTGAAMFGELDAALGRTRRAGLNRQSVVIDPGLGLGKRREQDLELIAALSALQRLEVPLSTSAGNCAEIPALTASILSGAHIVRCSDVKSVRAAADVADGILTVLARQAEKLADTEDSSASPAVRRPFAEYSRRTFGKVDPRGRTRGDNP